MIPPGSQITLSIEKPAAGGTMIARHDGEVVFVSGTIPGERVRACIQGYSRGVAHASVIDVIEPSPDRRSSAADPACGGNVFRHIHYARQLSLKREIVLDAFGRIARLPLPDLAVVESPEHGYRMRARLHAGGGRLGFFREGTHELCDPATTGQLLPETCRVIREIERRVPHVAAVDLAENLDASERVLHLEMMEWSGSAISALSRIVELPGVTGVTWRPARTISRGRARGEETRLVGGVSYVSDPIARVTSVPVLNMDPAASLRRRATAFFQANRFLLTRLTDAVIGACGDGGAIDLYSGVGLFAVALAAVGRGPVVAVEGDRANIEDLTANAAPFDDAIRIEHTSVESFLAMGYSAATRTVIVDPPRTGISRAAITLLSDRGPHRIVYVSCDAATLARDVQTLAGRGYRISQAEAFDLFPNTAHVETLVVLEQ